MCDSCCSSYDIIVYQYLNRYIADLSRFDVRPLNLHEDETSSCVDHSTVIEKPSGKRLQSHGKSPSLSSADQLSFSAIFSN